MPLICFLFALLFALRHVKSAEIKVSPRGHDDVECLESPSSHCATLDYALQGAQRFKNVTVLLANGRYTLSANELVSTFEDMEQFEIIGDERVVYINCTDFSGFSFYRSRNIHFRNVTISGCGSVHNSSSSKSEVKTDERTEYFEFLVGIYFLLCVNVTLDHVSVTDSPGTGVVFYSTSGINTIMFSDFISNGMNYSVSYSGGGGMAIEFLYCLPGDEFCSSTNGSYIQPEYYQNGVFQIVNCKFVNNTSVGENGTGLDAYIIPHVNYNVALGRGGGLSIVLKGKANRIKLYIQSCDFHSNLAVWGGGALLEFQDNASNNTVVFENNSFVNNKCDYDSCNYKGTGGGGIRVLFAGYDSLVKSNTVELRDLQFIDNEAYFGGGVSILTFPENVLTNKITFKRVNWNGNKARLGSAVDLSVWHLAFDGLFLQPTFVNCTLENNTVHYTEKLGTAGGAGTIYADTVPIKFKDEIRFTNNMGSAIYSVEARVAFDKNCRAVFIANHDQNGGGIALHSNSYIMLSNGTQLEFLNNNAVLHGGAIFWESIGSRYLISRNCFIRYETSLLDPTKWPVSLYFSGNSAGISGHDIFATTLLNCLWGGKPYGHQSEERAQYSKVFNWSSSIWIYDEPKDDSISTSPGHFIKDNKTNCGSSYSAVVKPGGFTKVPFQMSNDRFAILSSDSLVFSATVNDTNNSVQFIASGESELSAHGFQGEIKEYNISTLPPRAISTKLFLHLDDCPFGFIFSSTDMKCVSASLPYIQTHSDFSASIQRGYWIGTVKNEIVVSECFFCPFNKEFPSTNYIDLPDTNLTDFFCASMKRKGTKCYKCIDGYGPAVNSEQYKCVRCNEEESQFSWALYIVWKFIPLTVVLLLVIIFNISVTSGHANSFVLFAQVISTTFGVDAGQILDYSSITSSASVIRKVYISFYSLWNFDFFESLEVWLYCLHPKITELNILCLNYLTAMYPLLVLIIVAVLVAEYNKSNRIIVCLLRPVHRLLARCFRLFDYNRSIMDAFATFLVLSYVKFAVASALLLYPNPLQVANGKVVNYVSYLDPTKDYISREYAPYLIASLTVTLVCLVMPTILFLYSIKPFYHILGRCHLHRLLPGEKGQFFLNAFHHCYKDGSNGGHDRRYFASLYFFFRFILIFSYSLAFNWIVQFIVQQFLCTIAIVVISSFQPYKNHLFNVIDSTMFGLLAVINVLTIYQKYLDVANYPLSSHCFYIQTILIFLPMIYITLVTLFYSLRKCCLTLWSKRCNDNPEEDHDAKFSFSEFMDNVEAEGRFNEQKNYESMPSKEEDTITGEKSEVSILSYGSFRLSNVANI